MILWRLAGERMLVGKRTGCEEAAVAYESFDVPVTGGLLHVGRWGSGPAVVVAAHGVTGTHMNWEPLADQLGEAVTVLAPDLRGRGLSRFVGGPYGMARHADDVIAVLDHAGIAEAVMVGHSMGGFVAATAAARYRDRIRSLVLVDGGLPLQLGPLAGLPAEQAVRAVLGPSLDRLKMTFGSRQDYLDFWRAHPALADDWNDYLEQSFSYDLAGEAPALTSTVREDAVLADSADFLRSDDLEQALSQITQPVVMLRAPLGLLNQEPPLYPARVPNFTDVLVPGVNHYTIALTSRGAQKIAEAIRMTGR
jgi:lipase